MKLLVGLGNPGEKYAGTRHNAGFLFLDKLICEKELAPAGACLTFSNNEKFKSLEVLTEHKGEKFLLLKPQTFMNLSGEAVSKAMAYYKLDITDLIVISDDVDLPIGTVRVRQVGSSGGQKGLQNIIEQLGSDNFLRIRIGIRSIGGNPKETINLSEFDTADFVLSKFSKRELPLLDLAVEEAVKYMLPFLGSKSEIPAHTLEAGIDSV